MFLWLLILTGLIFIILLIFFLFSTTTVHIEYKSNPDLQMANANVYLLRTFHVYKKSMKFDNGDILSEDEREEVVKQKIEKGIDITFKSYDTIATYNDLLKSINKKIRKGLKADKFELSTTIGTGDAATTALLSGLLWAIFGNLRMQRPDILLTDIQLMVRPDFKKKIFAIDIDCIFTLKTVYIIYIFNSIEKIFKMEKERAKKINMQSADGENISETR